MCRNGNERAPLTNHCHPERGRSGDRVEGSAVVLTVALAFALEEATKPRPLRGFPSKRVRPRTAGAWDGESDHRMPRINISYRLIAKTRIARVESANALLDRRNHSVGKLAGTGRPTNVAGQRLALGVNGLQRLLQPVGGGHFVQMAKHEDGGLQ